MNYLGFGCLRINSNSGRRGLARPTENATEFEIPVSSDDLFDPLNEFYKRSHQNQPRIVPVMSANLPEPYRGLLAHNGDMTARLESFHGRMIHLEVLESVCSEQTVLRKVVLVLESSGEKVEFGAIRISLALFDPEPRDRILEGKLPLGTILKRYGVDYLSRPQAFLEVLSDGVVGDALGLGACEKLYGRQNSILNPRGELLAKVVEILPPSKTTGTGVDTSGES